MQWLRVCSKETIHLKIMLHSIRSQNPLSAFALVLVFVAGLFSTASHARASTDLPARAEVQSQLDALNKQKDHTPQDKLVIDDLTQTLDTLDKLERVKQESAQLRQKVAQAPDKMREATDGLNALSDKD